MANEPTGLGFKEYLGTAFSGLAGHYLIPTLGDFSKARFSSIKGQTNGIKNRRFTRTIRTRQSKDAVGYIFWVSEIYYLFTGERVEVIKSEFKYLHNRPLYSALKSFSWRDLVISL